MQRIPLWWRVYARNVGRRFLYRQYTNLFIFRFLSEPISDENNILLIRAPTLITRFYSEQKNTLEWVGGEYGISPEIFVGPS